MRILLVEDNSDHRELMRLALTEYDATWQVEGVGSGEEALCRLAEGKAYDVVFLDYSLPGRDGLEMLAEIRRGEAPPLVVMVTGRGDEQVAVEAMKGGAYDYVVKGEGYRQRLPVVAQRALEAQQLAVDRKRAEEALRQSEERYRAVLEQSPDAIYLVDRETKSIIEANTAFAHLLGYPLEALIGMSIYDFIGVDREEIDRTFMGMPEKGSLLIERQLRRKDGSLVDVWISAKIITYGDKRVNCAVARDLTERKRAEKALQESEERYRAIMGQSADGICLIDLETRRILEANPAYARMLGYDPREVLGLNNYDIVAGGKEEIDQRFQEIIRSEAPLSFERTYRRKDGSLLEVWLSISTISYRGKRVVCVLVRDLTERKQAEAERERMIHGLGEALANIKTLSGLIPICAQCKKIRDDKGYWQQVEVYVRDHSEAKFSHGLCPECTKLLFPELQEKRKGGNSI